MVTIKELLFHCFISIAKATLLNPLPYMELISDMHRYCNVFFLRNIGIVMLKHNVTRLKRFLKNKTKLKIA
jgi:hypothetical protein